MTRPSLHRVSAEPASLDDPPAAPAPEDYERAARIREALVRFERASERVVRRHGLTPQRYLLLLMVRTARDGRGHARLRELMERLDLAQSTVVELVQRAVSAGLLERAPSRDSRRAIVVRLTEEGERRLAGALAELGRHREDLVAIVGDLARSTR